MALEGLEVDAIRATYISKCCIKVIMTQICLFLHTYCAYAVVYLCCAVMGRYMKCSLIHVERRRNNFQFLFMNQIKQNCKFFYTTSWLWQLGLRSLKIYYFAVPWVRILRRPVKSVIFFLYRLFFVFSPAFCQSYLRGYSQTMWTGKGEGKYFSCRLLANQLVVHLPINYFLGLT